MVQYFSGETSIRQWYSTLVEKPAYVNVTVLNREPPYVNGTLP
jgi:hypothetical protein